MKKRLRKKIYKKVIPNICADISVHTYWREQLFSSSSTLKIDSNSKNGIDEEDLSKVKYYKLEILVRPCNYSELPVEWRWFDKNLVYFKFWSDEFPSFAWYSANNPDVV